MARASTGVRVRDARDERRGEPRLERAHVLVRAAMSRIDVIRDPAGEREPARAIGLGREQRVVEAAEAHAHDEHHGQREPRGELRRVDAGRRAARGNRPTPSTITHVRQRGKPGIGTLRCDRARSSPRPAPRRCAARSAARSSTDSRARAGAATLPAASSRSTSSLRSAPSTSSAPAATGFMPDDAQARARQTRAAARRRRASCRRRCRCR